MALYIIYNICSLRVTRGNGIRFSRTFYGEMRYCSSCVKVALVAAAVAAVVDLDVDDASTTEPPSLHFFFRAMNTILPFIYK